MGLYFYATINLHISFDLLATIWLYHLNYGLLTVMGIFFDGPCTSLMFCLGMLTIMGRLFATGLVQVCYCMLAVKINNRKERLHEVVRESSGDTWLGRGSSSCNVSKGYKEVHI